MYFTRCTCTWKIIKYIKIVKIDQCINHKFSIFKYDIQLWYLNTNKILKYIHTKCILTENAFRNTRHCMMPSIVSPVKQNVPVRWRPLRPITEQRLAWTKAFCDRVAAVRAGWCDPELINRSSESISPLRDPVYRVPLFKTQCSSVNELLSASNFRSSMRRRYIQWLFFS